MHYENGARLWNWPGIKYSNMGLYKARNLQIDTPAGLHHHRALFDCYITAALLLDILQETGWTPEEMVTITGRPTLMTTFTFGKYRGEEISEIARRDPGYLRWMRNSFTNMTPQMRLTINHYLGED